MTTDRRHVVVLTGGGPATIPFEGLPPHAYVIAADSGIALASRLGLVVDLVIGDMDSADPDHLGELEAGGTKIVRHPVAKNATDLELAIDAALDHGAGSVTVMGGGAGRLDHLLGNVLVLTAEKYAALDMCCLMGSTRITVVRGTVELWGAPGELVSLFAIGGTAEGVTTDGLLYPLNGESLGVGSTRGVSNVFNAKGGAVTVESGVLIAVQPPFD